MHERHSAEGVYFMDTNLGTLGNVISAEEEDCMT